MMIPFNVDVPMQRVPVANGLIITGTIAAFILFFADRTAESGWTLLWRGNRFEWAQLLGHLLGHLGWLHLIGNMVFLFVFGNAVNAKLGHAAFLALYAVSGATAGLAWLVLGAGPTTVGASGAIFGVMGAFAALFPTNDVSVFYWFGYLGTGTFSVSSIWVVIWYVGWDLLAMVLDGESVVNHIAHLSGAVAGFLITLGLIGAGLLRPTVSERFITRLGTLPPDRRPWVWPPFL